MSTRSLAFRLSCAAALAIAIALGLAALGLETIFNREIDRRAVAELGQTINVLAGQARLEGAGPPIIDVPPRDPRFDTPYSGLYWQVSAGNDRSRRSRSLWDTSLIVSAKPADAENHWVTDLAGPSNSKLLAVVQDITVPAPSGDGRLQIVAAIDRADIAASQRYLNRLLYLSIGALGILLIAAMSIFIHLALRPFNALRRELGSIHAGHSRALAGQFPDEVQPVVDDLNRLIAFQDAALSRARSQAGDLAHALKTPLAVLGSVARQARDGDRSDLAEPIDEQIVLMGRQVDRVLARARASLTAAMSRAAIPAAPVAEKIVRALRRLPDDRSLQWENTVAADAVFPGEEGDLTELLANLLDNARKWASTRVRLTMATDDRALIVVVDDDGPGLQPEQIRQIGRGKRWDETLPGTGFGLAIVRDLTEAYRGQLDLDRSELGGLRARIAIPLPDRNARTAR